MYKTRHNFTIHCQPYCLEVKLNADFSSNYLTTTPTLHLRHEDVVVMIVVGFTTTLQSVPITTKIVSSNPVHGELHSIQHYVIKFVSDFRQVSGFLRYPPRYN